MIASQYLIILITLMNCLPNARRQLQAARNRADGLGDAHEGAPTDSCTP
jgi:hypothetical protein